MSWTFLKTDSAMFPTLEPTTIVINEERFDDKLLEKCGAQLGRALRVGHKGITTSYIAAYLPKVGTYEGDVVIIDIMPADTVLRVNGERYLIKREDWEKVRALGAQHEPSEHFDQRSPYAHML